MVGVIERITIPIASVYRSSGGIFQQNSIQNANSNAQKNHYNFQFFVLNLCDIHIGGNNCFFGKSQHFF